MSTKKTGVVHTIIAEQKDYVTGTIDLSLTNGNEAYVIPNQQN